jgi:NADH dehydrogenase FAD-containing subunit
VSPWVIALLLLVVAATGFHILRSGLDDATFVVTVKGSGAAGVEILGEVPGHGNGEVIRFVADLELPAGAKISGIRDGDRIMLRFSTEVPDHLHQRLRNFFYLHV